MVQQAVSIDSGPVTGTLLHVICERDVGLFSLVQQVIAHIPWAFSEGRVPVANYRERCCYWTPAGHHGKHSVWEYYFEPIVAAYPAGRISNELLHRIAENFPQQNELGYFASATAFVTNHYGDHPVLSGRAPQIPYATADPDDALRLETSRIVRDFVRPRPYIERKVNAFYEQRMRGSEVIGVHVRGTDAVSARETREYRRGSLDLPRFVHEIRELLRERPRALLFVATDAQSSLDYLTDHFGQRVVAYDAIRHVAGEPAGQGPTGCIMPAYIANDAETAAQNGEDAVAEYLLLARCAHLVHNGASLATTVLLREPALGHTNTHRAAEPPRVSAPEREFH